MEVGMDSLDTGFNACNKQYKFITKDFVQYFHDSHKHKGLICPHCNSHHIIKNGKSGGRQRYLCKACKKTFNDLTKTPFAGIQNLSKLNDYIYSMINGDSLRESARKSKISLQKSFFLRHKISAAISDFPQEQLENLQELKEVISSYSVKGSKDSHICNKKISTISIIFKCDRNNKLQAYSHSSEKSFNNKILYSLQVMRNSDKEYCHNNTKTLDYFFHNSDIYNVNTEKFSSEFYNCKTIDKLIDEWEIWMKRFHGVSSKYLDNYLCWNNFLNNCKYSKADRLLHLLAKFKSHYRYIDISNLEIDSH
jgi:transposase-like protein